MDGSNPIQRADALIPRPGNERREKRPQKRFDPEALAGDEVQPEPQPETEIHAADKPVGHALADETGSSLDITA